MIMHVVIIMCGASYQMSQEVLGHYVVHNVTYDCIFTIVQYLYIVIQNFQTVYTFPTTNILLLKMTWQ